ncbi:DNA repair protein RecO [TM7 phylum sp. oral taxon 350]|nr:DNA repair protein RecO [TM7 phylum sp. oral taxon 350]
MKNEKLKAIVLRRTNYQEADRILDLVTPLGKRSVIARGVRKEKSRLAGSVELLCESEIVLTKSNKSSLAILTSARLIRFYGNILKSYDRMTFAYDTLKNIGKAVNQIEEPEWYDLLSQVLSGLDDLKIDLRLIRVWFLLQYQKLLGNELNMLYDVDGKKLEKNKKYTYDYLERGLKEDIGGKINGDVIKFLRVVNNNSLDLVTKIGGIDSVLGDALALAENHFN